MPPKNGQLGKGGEGGQWDHFLFLNCIFQFRMFVFYRAKRIGVVCALSSPVGLFAKDLKKKKQ